MSTKAEHATKLHENGCNCAQAVACSFCREFGIDENEMFRIAEGFGLGMGVMEMCGALSGMAMIIGLSCICRELKGVETGKVLCSCPQCITDAVALTEEYLAENR